MGRPREFDIEEALRGAMEIFWRQGFKATPLPDLLRAMGLTRGSFYKAFADKRHVYLAALDRYDAEVIAPGAAALRGCAAADPVECLALLFEAPKDPRLGCFICNAMIEMAPEDEEVARRTQAMSASLAGAMEAVLLRRGFGPRAPALADLILHLYFGDQAMGRAGTPRADWRAALGHLLQSP